MPGNYSHLLTGGLYIRAQKKALLVTPKRHARGGTLKVWQGSEKYQFGIDIQEP